MQSRISRESNTLDTLPEIRDMATMEELGELRKVYTISKQNTNPFGIGVLCTIFGLSITPFIFSPSPPPPVIAIPGFLLLMIGCYLVFSRRIYARMSSRHHIYLWQYGFIYEKGQTRQVFRWDQIDNIHASVRSNTSFCKICRQDGYKVGLSYAFSERNELIDTLFEAFARQFAPQDLIIAPPKSIRRFVDVKLDRQGIGNAQEAIPWQEIHEFMPKDGMITLGKKTPE